MQIDTIVGSFLYSLQNALVSLKYWENNSKNKLKVNKLILLKEQTNININKIVINKNSSKIIIIIN